MKIRGRGYFRRKRVWKFKTNIGWGRIGWGSRGKGRIQGSVACTVLTGTLGILREARQFLRI